MKLWSAKTGIAGVVALLLAGIGLLCSRPANKPPLRLVFLSASNDVQTGTCWGRFRLENKSTNYMGVGSAYFQERTGLGWTRVAGAYDPRPGAKSLTPPLIRRGALTFRTQVPGGQASYRLVMEVVPCIEIRDVGKPLPTRTDIAYRAGSFLLRLGLLPRKFQQSLLSNSRWLKTRPFRVSSPNPSPEPTSAAGGSQGQSEPLVLAGGSVHGAAGERERFGWRGFWMLGQRHSGSVKAAAVIGRHSCRNLLHAHEAAPSGLTPDGMLPIVEQ